MALTVSEGSSYVPVPAGTYAARLVALIDLGHQISNWEGAEKSAHKILLTFEICDAEVRREDGAAHTISRRFTASLHAKAALRQLLESWRGRQFTAEELRKFDMKTVLGLACMVNIIHETKGDKTFANLSSIMRLPKGFDPGIQTEPVVHFDLDAPNWTTFAQLPSRLADQIALSPEFAALKKPASVSLPAAGAPAARAPAPVAGKKGGGDVADSGFDDFPDSDIPF